MITSGVIKGLFCPVCQASGHVCGDNHMRRGPIDTVVSDGGIVAPEPQELREYQYVVNNMITTAMLTPKMAERLGATEVGSDPQSLNGGYTNKQNQAVFGTTDMAQGVTGDGAVDPLRPEQQGIDDEGRTPSMRPPLDGNTTPPNAEPVDGEKSQTTDGVASKVRRPARDK